MSTWERVSFRVFGLCDKDARTKVGSYVKLAWDCINSKLERAAVCERLKRLTEGDDELSLTWAVEHIRKTNCYENWEEELRYLLYRYEEHLANSQGTRIAADQWSRIWEDSASNTIEHILPQSSEDEENTPMLHWLGNLMLLPPGLNSSLGAKDPSEKVADYRSTGLLLANRVADTIEENGGWVESHIVSREEQIISCLEKEWF